MAVPIYFMFLAVLIGSSVGQPMPGGSLVVYQQIDSQPVNPALQKKVTVGAKDTTLTTMTSGGPPDYKVRDTITKVILAPPDSHRNINDHQLKHLSVNENLKTSAKGTKDGHLEISARTDNKLAQTVVHKDGRTVTTTKGEQDGHASATGHGKLTDPIHQMHKETMDSCEHCVKRSQSVTEGKDSNLVKSREERGDWNFHDENTNMNVHDAKRTAHTDNQRIAFKHENLQTAGTVQTVHDGKNNVMIGAMHDVHTETVTGNHDSQSATNEEVTSVGKVKSKSNIYRENVEAADVHQHLMNAYHETPMHKFIMNNKQVREDRYRQLSLNTHYDTQTKKKDGTNVDTHAERRVNMDTSRLQHTDELRIKAINKENPTKPASEVKMQARIVDRDHLQLNQHERQHTTTTMPNGGRRVVTIDQERNLSNKLDTDGSHADRNPHLSQEVHNAEKVVTPADRTLMQPLTHHYIISKKK
ncbi:uncharacterized protein LOC111050532 [Nilaparvata lugens]|uniref:uncharacterized protein LOC111050532 n=1 Tax=Nilaparvata lugens TaxID=108931 RepID=UPI00193E6B57|nr:uncharacterized protein LOC111050532 [Nilaparvata lugens]WJX09099.1 putative salivary protein [Nilaparvata lugens]